MHKQSTSRKSVSRGKERESYFQLPCVNLFSLFKDSNLHAVLIKPLDCEFNSAALAIRRPDETLEDAPESAFSDLQLRSKLLGRSLRNGTRRFPAFLGRLEEMVPVDLPMQPM